MLSLFNPWVILAVVVGLGLSHGGAYFKGRSNGVAATDIKWERVIAKDRADFEKRQREAEEAANSEINKLLNEKEADDLLITELRAQALADPGAANCGIGIDSLRRLNRGFD